VESTELVGAYTADFHHNPHPPRPDYSVDAVADELAQAKAAVATPAHTDGSSRSDAASNGQHLIKP